MKLALSLITVAGLAAISIAEPPKELPKTIPTKVPAHAVPSAPAVPAVPAVPTPTTSHTGATPADTKAPSYDEMMKMWADMNKPTAEHKELAKLVGEWDMTIKGYNPMNPTDVHVSTGTEKVEWLIEGRYLKSHTTGTMGKEAFEGFGFNGYNTMTKKFETTWVDNMSTGQMLYTGTIDANHVLTETCEFQDPMTGAKKFSKMVCTWTNDNTRGFKMYEVDGSTETLSMEATYTRKGTSNAGESKSLTDKVDAATKSASDAIKKALPTK